MLTFNEIIDTFSRINPLKTVVREESRELSYKELEINGTLLASYLLKLGISKGDRVGVLAYNCIEYAEIFYATAKIGAIIAPINFRLSTKEIINIWRDATPKCFIFQKSFINILKFMENIWVCSLC